MLLEESAAFSLRTRQYTGRNANGWIEKRKHIESGISQTPRLYDLLNDAGERHNIATSEPEVVEAMAAELKRIENHPQSR